MLVALLLIVLVLKVTGTKHRPILLLSDWESAGTRARMVCEGGLTALWLAGELPEVFFLQASPKVKKDME